MQAVVELWPPLMAWSTGPALGWQALSVPLLPTKSLGPSDRCLWASPWALVPSLPIKVAQGKEILGGQ